MFYATRMAYLYLFVNEMMMADIIQIVIYLHVTHLKTDCFACSFGVTLLAGSDHYLLDLTGEIHILS